MITGKTKCIGILGWPVEHSMSPLMQNAAFAANELNYVYIPMPVHPDQLATAISGFKALGFAGANVTIPHKIAVMPYLDELDRSAKMVGAVNTIVAKDNKLYGYNTDAIGFVQPLLKQGVSLTGKNIGLLGAGGAARAVVWGLIEQGVAEITIGVRSIEKARELVDIFSPLVKIQAIQWPSDEFNEKLRYCHVLVNSTPIGMYPHIDTEPPVDWSLFTNRITAYDLIYTPPKTNFLKTAERFNHLIINGAGMLVEQGAAAFTLWTGLPAPVDIMYQALQNTEK
jgi:shikimate dehydrogenase